MPENSLYTKCRERGANRRHLLQLLRLLQTQRRRSRRMAGGRHDPVAGSPGQPD